MAFRENMKTEWQWLQEGRIPNPNARWEYGETLNNTFNVCSYGSSYCAIVIKMRLMRLQVLKSYRWL